MWFLSPLFIEGLLQKPQAHHTSRWLVHGRDVTRRG